MPRTIEYYVATSIDGFIAREDGSFADFAPDQTQLALYLDRIQTQYDTVLMGRATFEVGLSQGVRDPYPWLDTHVFSNTLEPGSVPEVSIHGESAPEVVSKLRAREGGRIWLCGGGELASALIDAGLIDRLVLKRYPVVLGGGVPLFRGSEPQRLKLGPCERHDSGVRIEEYELDTTIT